MRTPTTSAASTKVPPASSTPSMKGSKGRKRTEWSGRKYNIRRRGSKYNIRS